MTDTPKNVPVKPSQGSAVTPQSWRPFESLRREIDHLFEDFDRGFWRRPFRLPDVAWSATPAVDFIEKDDSFELTAELPGLDEKNIEVKLSNGGLTIKGEKQEEKEEKKKDYHLHERSFGSFERYLSLPDGVDTDKIEANFKKGVLKVTLPKRPEARKAEKKIEVKAS